MDIVIARLDKIYPSGDWHDKPMKWAVIGPRGEQQHFSTKANATIYKRIRGKAESQSDAITRYVRGIK
jgi:hypothetical protein